MIPVSAVGLEHYSAFFFTKLTYSIHCANVILDDTVGIKISEIKLLKINPCHCIQINIVSSRVNDPCQCSGLTDPSAFMGTRPFYRIWRTGGKRSLHQSEKHS